RGSFRSAMPPSAPEGGTLGGCRFRGGAGTAPGRMNRPGRGAPSGRRGRFSCSRVPPARAPEFADAPQPAFLPAPVARAASLLPPALHGEFAPVLPRSRDGFLRLLIVPERGRPR